MASLGSSQSITLIDDDSRKATPFPLIEFTQFAKLPAELRRMIYKFAIPTKDILRVSVRSLMINSELGVIIFEFRVWDATATDTALLAACKESRDIYMQVRRATLPGYKKNLIRYDPEDTIIQIDKFERDFMFCADLAEGVRKGWGRQNWMREIKRLAVYTSFRSFRVYSTWGEGGIGQLLSIFENLEELASITTRGIMKSWVETLGEDYWRAHKYGPLEELRETLEIHRRKSNPNYKIPKISLMMIEGEAWS